MAGKLKVLDLFSGIGGFSLGLERTGGFETVAFCEIDPFCRKVLAKHWPNVRQYEDVRKLTADTLARDGIGVDVITGGFPCQDISCAGRQAGIGAGTRSGLWSEIFRLASELSPSYVFVENVPNLLSGPSEQPGGWFGRILGDLASLGYDAEWHCVPASYVGAPHIRDRVWIVAHPDVQENHIGSLGKVFTRRGLPRGNSSSPWGTAMPAISRMGDGVPGELDRLGALGNAVVPQIPELIGRAILDAISLAEPTPSEAAE